MLNGFLVNKWTLAVSTRRTFINSSSPVPFSKRASGSMRGASRTEAASSSTSGALAIVRRSMRHHPFRA
jgi:hypothetical protein